MKAIIYADLARNSFTIGLAENPFHLGGRTLLEWHALRLRAAEVREVVLVTGYLREQIAELLPGICARHDIAVRDIVNPRFREGSLLSLKVSLPEIENSSEPLLLMDAESVFIQLGCFTVSPDRYTPLHYCWMVNSPPTTMIPCSCRLKTDDRSTFASNGAATPSSWANQSVSSRSLRLISPSD